MTVTWNKLCEAYETFIADHGEEIGNTPLRIAHWSDPSRDEIEIVFEPGYPAVIVTLPASAKE